MLSSSHILNKYISKNIKEKLNSDILDNFVENIYKILHSENSDLLENGNLSNQANNLNWQKKSQVIISYLETIKKSQSVSKETFAEILEGINNYVNGVDYSVIGKAQKKTKWDFTFVSYTQGFKEFYKNFNAYMSANREKNNLFTQSKNALSLVLNTFQQALTYINAHPYQTAALVLASQAAVADALTSNDPSNDPNLVAYYPFDGNALDATGNGNDGTVYGARLVLDRFEDKNSAYYFDGKSYISGNAVSYPRGDRTISLWFKPDYWPQTTGVDRSGGMFGHCGISSDYSANLAIALNQGIACGMVAKNNYITWSWGLPNTVLYCYEDLYGTPFVWNQLTFTSSSENGMSIYINGAIQCQQMSYMKTNGYVTDFTIGSIAVNNAPYNDSCTPMYRGSIDDVMIYNRALTGSEVKSLYEKQKIKQSDDSTSQNHGFSKTTVGLIAGSSCFVVGAASAAIFCFFKKRKTEKRLPMVPDLNNQKIDSEESSSKRQVKKIQSELEMHTGYGTFAQMKKKDTDDIEAAKIPFISEDQKISEEQKKDSPTMERKLNIN